MLPSFLIGVAFLPNLGTYLLGFGAADVARGGAGWACAVAVAGASAAPLALRRRLAPEDWPLTPFALFPYSGEQWDALFACLVRGRVRLVLSAAAAAAPVGCRVVRKEGPAPSPAGGGGAVCVYDGWEQVDCPRAASSRHHTPRHHTN